jgi:hypothetical protein
LNHAKNPKKTQGITQKPYLLILPHRKGRQTAFCQKNSDQNARPLAKQLKKLHALGGGNRISDNDADEVQCGRYENGASKLPRAIFYDLVFI